MNDFTKNTIELHNLRLGYHAENALIEDVTASVVEGEMVAIIGRNGSGKSTLLRTLAGLQKPLNGHVTIENESILTIDRKKMAGLVAFVGTSVKSPENLTVFEMVSLGRFPYTNWWGRLNEKDRTIIYRSLNFVGMKDFSDINMDRLSDGEKQRVIIAMALAQDAKIIILDEPTAFLDIPNRMEVADVLYKMKASGKSIIYSTHDFETALHFADKIWLIHNRNLIEGAPEDLGMMNLYNDIFQESGMYFDIDSQHFRKNKSFLKEICFSTIENTAGIWTKLMLERIGYRVVEESRTDGTLQLELRNRESFLWVLTEKNGDVEFNSLYELALYLNN